jgi:hypothetical protein
LQPADLLLPFDSSAAPNMIARRMSSTDQETVFPHTDDWALRDGRRPRRLAWGLRLVGALLVAGVSHGIALAAGRVEPISGDWSFSGQAPVKVRRAEASSSLSEQYAPERICDGNRRNTKWVSPVRPTTTAPQWVTLSLAGGPRSVTSVAVFGERIDNDGIIDADIQVKTGGEFKTVATVRDATSAAWLAQFEAITTDEVRLLVLRSGGPTDHTDVYEIEVYGNPPSDAELRVRLSEALKGLQQAVTVGGDPAASAASGATSIPAQLRAAWGRATNCLKELSGRQTDWATAPRAVLTHDLDEAEEAVAAIERTRVRLAQRAAGASRRADLLARVRATGRGLAATTGAATEASTPGGVLTNSAMTVWLEPDGLQWNAVWHDPVPVVLAGIGFSVEVDGTNVVARPAKALSRRFQDELGEGVRLVQIWEQGGVAIARELRLYSNCDVLSIAGRIVNSGATEIHLGTANLLNVSDQGGWDLGSTWEAPAAVYIQSHSLLRSKPFATPGGGGSGATQNYGSSGVLALACREPNVALVAGYLRADEASPDLTADFRVDEGGTSLSAASRFMGRVLRPGETIELNRVYLAAGTDAFQALEAYGEALALCGPHPARTGPTGLWCSWYAHRMGMTEEKVLANAAVAARHFRPLGLEIMQLDHGWQRGDITGDWVTNERFPHGLRWLADELKRRHDLRLGVWIAPTDVAETSELYRRHPDWMLRGSDGKPLVNWRWYWKPNPNCYELDATQPEAYRRIVEDFRRLTSEGVSYYKIDFIASAGGEQFLPHDRTATRGWSSLQRAMHAIREGAGERAWIRYCQTPPVLSVGLANSVIGGDDTLDAGVPGRFDLLRDNAHALAAGWWLNDRPYHREVCDMSVRMQGSVEEVRVRAALMALANCSISWSDELCYLPPSRIHLMQQCMPPGNPPMRPLDLFEREVPSVWHLKMTNAAGAWDVVGLFNFDRPPATRAVRYADLGLDPRAEYAVFEFWEERFLGVLRDGVELSLPGESSRILSIRRVTGVPQLVGTDMHLLQGWHEVKQVAWDEKVRVLSGRYVRMPGLRGKAFFRIPPGYTPKFEFPLGPDSARLTHVADQLWMQEVEFTERDFSWTIPFEAPRAPDRKEPTGT